MEKHENDCFGLYYDPLLTPCRDYCLVRKKCQAVVADRMKASAHELNTELASRHVTSDLQPEISPLISEVMAHCESLGMRSHFKRYYLVFKDQKRRSLLHCSRLQTKKLHGVIRFVRLKEREEFPESIRQWVSHEKCCGQHYFCGHTMDELKKCITAYYATVCEVSS